MTGNRRSPLDSLHRELNAKMVPFGGWEMPLSYPSGTIAEHVACRTHAALFDVSHLGTVRLEGVDALARLQSAFTNDLAKIGVGRAQYTHSCNDHGGVVDDIIVWWVGEQRFDVMPNASNTDSILGVIGGTDTTGTRAVLAVQGPKARELLAKVSSAAANVKRFRLETINLLGAECVVAGTGYTGEDGVEIAAPIDISDSLARVIIDAGVVPAGLGARDTLQRTVEQRAVRRNEIRRQTRLVDGEAVILRGDEDATGAQILHGMVRAVMTELHLHGARTAREAE